MPATPKAPILDAPVSTPAAPVLRGHRALRSGRVSLPQHAYLVSTVTADRSRHFLDFHAGCVASACFEKADVLGDARMLAWVLMPDHVHWLIQLGDRDPLAEVVNRLKSASARCANAALGRSGTLWARAFHDRALRRDEHLAAVARYLVANPLRAGLVSQIGDYPFWNASWL